MSVTHAWSGAARSNRRAKTLGAMGNGCRECVVTRNRRRRRAANPRTRISRATRFLLSLIFGKCSFLNSVGIDSVVGQSGSPTCWRRHEVQNDGLDLRFISWPQCLGLAFVANTTVVRGHAARSAGLPVTRRRNVRGEDHPLGRGAAGPKLCASWCLATGGLSFAKTLSGGQVVDLSARIRRQSESHDHHPAVG